MIDKADGAFNNRPPGAVDPSVGDATQIEQHANTFDTVAQFSVIHHVPGWRATLAEIARVLKPAAALFTRALSAR